MDSHQKYSNTNIMLAKEGVGILSLRTKCRDRDEHKRVIHSENKCMASLCDFCVFGIWSRSPGCMCTFGLYAADRWRSFLVTPAPLSLSLFLFLFLSLSILQKISLESHPTGFYSIATEITIVLDLVCVFSRNGSQHETFLWGISYYHDSILIF